MAYTVRYERDEDGWWIVEVPVVKGCRTQARTLREARERIRDALSLFVDDAEEAELADDIRLASRGKKAIESLKKARHAAHHASSAAAAAAHTAARVLTKDLGLSTRDAAEVLGVSHQRIHQLATARARKGAGRDTSGGGQPG